MASLTTAMKSELYSLNYIFWCEPYRELDPKAAPFVPESINARPAHYGLNPAAAVFVPHHALVVNDLFADDVYNEDGNSGNSGGSSKNKDNSKSTGSTQNTTGNTDSDNFTDRPYEEVPTAQEAGYYSQDNPNENLGDNPADDDNDHVYVDLELVHGKIGGQRVYDCDHVLASIEQDNHDEATYDSGYDADDESTIPTASVGNSNKRQRSSFSCGEDERDAKRVRHMTSILNNIPDGLMRHGCSTCGYIFITSDNARHDRSCDERELRCFELAWRRQRKALSRSEFRLNHETIQMSEQWTRDDPKWKEWEEQVLGEMNDYEERVMYGKKRVKAANYSPGWGHEQERARWLGYGRHL